MVVSIKCLPQALSGEACNGTCNCTHMRKTFKSTHENQLLTRVFDYLIVCVWSSMSILSFWFWKLLILHRNKKGFPLRSVYQHLQAVWTYRAPISRNQQCVRVLFFKASLFKEWNKKFVALLALLTTEKQLKLIAKMVTFFELYTVYINN